MTLSTPVKVVALAGLALMLGAAGLLLLSSHGSSSPSAVHHATAARTIHITTPARHAPVVKAKPKLVLDPSLPPAVARKLHLSHEAVVFAYTGASASDRALLTQVREGAHSAGVPFVPLNVTDEKTAVAVHGWADTSADPVTLVVKRPGTILFQVQGLTDSQAVAQAAASAR
jgi:hypothetical protein